MVASPSSARNATTFVDSLFGKANSPVYLTAQCLNTEFIIKAFLCHICV